MRWAAQWAPRRTVTATARPIAWCSDAPRSTVPNAGWPRARTCPWPPSRWPRPKGSPPAASATPSTWSRSTPAADGLRGGAEVGTAQLVAPPELVARPRVGDRPLLHHQGGVGMAQGPDVLLDEDHGHAILLDPVDDRE